MRLDRFITHPSRDILMLLAGHMDVRALFRLGKVSKRLQKYAVDGNHIYLSMLHTFPGIKELPQGKNDKFYINALSKYYDDFILPKEEFDFYRRIAHVLKVYPKDGLDPEEFKFESRYTVLSIIDGGLIFCCKGREIMIRQIQGWKNEIKLHPVTPLHDLQIGKILDMASAKAISSFYFISDDENDGQYGYYTFICIEKYDLLH